MSTPILQFDSVSKWFGTDSKRIRALSDVTLEIGAGEFVVLIGRSGSGKSTLIHLAAGLEEPTQGTVAIEGTSIATLSDDAVSQLRRSRISLVFQAFHLVGYLSAEENVALPLRFAGTKGSDARERAQHVLDAVGLAGRGHHRPSELSGGEMQRVAIARAVVVKPRLLLADEPTGNLDSTTGGEILSLLRALSERERLTVVLATHDDRAAAIAGRVLRLSDGALVEESRGGAHKTRPVTGG
jgi:putative ABC transport system ATP-binding protein